MKTIVVVSILCFSCMIAALATAQTPLPESGAGGTGTKGAATAAKINWKRFHLTLRNSCDRPVSVVRHSKMPAAMPWVTRGWTNLQPGQERRINLLTNNTIYYLYATTPDGKTIWSGKGKQGSINKFINMRRFTRIASEPVEGNDWKLVSLFRRQYKKGQYDDTVNFQCK